MWFESQHAQHKHKHTEWSSKFHYHVSVFFVTVKQKQQLQRNTLHLFTLRLVNQLQHLILRCLKHVRLQQASLLTYCFTMHVSAQRVNEVKRLQTCSSWSSAPDKRLYFLYFCGSFLIRFLLYYRFLLPHTCTFSSFGLLCCGLFSQSSE